jgi:hypothetical protein
MPDESRVKSTMATTKKVIPAKTLPSACFDTLPHYSLHAASPIESPNLLGNRRAVAQTGAARQSLQRGMLGARRLTDTAYAGSPL